MVEHRSNWPGGGQQATPPCWSLLRHQTHLSSTCVTRSHTVSVDRSLCPFDDTVAASKTDSVLRTVSRSLASAENGVARQSAAQGFGTGGLRQCRQRLCWQHYRTYRCGTRRCRRAHRPQAAVRRRLEVVQSHRRAWRVVVRAAPLVLHRKPQPVP
jgi:hypothetical protein